jgi:hypothetical protein
MSILITAMALAAAQPSPAPPATNLPAQHTPAGQVDHSKMDHSKMGHSNMAQHGDGCCKKGADGKMECTMGKKPASGTQGHSGH